MVVYKVRGGAGFPIQAGLAFSKQTDTGVDAHLCPFFGFRKTKGRSSIDEKRLVFVLMTAMVAAAAGC